MSFLFKLRFNKNGCSTDSGITSITPSSKVNIFSEPSSLKNGDTCVTFPPFNYEVGLKKRTEINIGTNVPFTIYLKYKIDINCLDDSYNVPIISYGNEGTTTNLKNPTKAGVYTNFLFIQNKEYFSILLNKQEGFSSKIISYTFDNKWHTLCITRDSDKIVRFFIDGKLSTKNTSLGTAIYLGNTIYIAKYKPGTNISVSLDGGSLDDICILNECIYKDNFIPPTMYFTGKDSKENYKYYNKSNLDNLTPEIHKAVEDKMFSTATHINNRQMGWLPRRLRIKWYEHTRQYFRNEEYCWTNPAPDSTVLNIYGFEIPYIYGYDKYRFVEGNAYRLWQQNKILAFLLFINGKFIKLSDINFVKSDWWMTFFIRGRDPRFNDRVKSVEMIIIPFPIIYEEGLGERDDIRPLYSFSENGLFDSSNGYTFYYIDKSKAPSGIKDIGILEQYIPTTYDDSMDNDKYDDSMFMHNIWRYGTLSLQSTSGKSGTFRFNCTSDSKHVQPGDQINLYFHTIYISPDRYRVVGSDLIEFYDYNQDNIDNYVVTMQMVTDNRTWELQDLTNVRFASVTAEIDNQSVFNIPEVVDSDGYEYRYFLIFRGSVCIMNTDRYIIDDDYTTLTFTNTEDFVPKGTTIYFVFVKLLKADQFGPLHVKPIFLSSKVDPDNTGNFGEDFTYKIKIPDLHGLEYNKNNVMLFLQNTFISPERYDINNNEVTITKYSGDKFLRGKHVVFVLLKMVNRIEDPLDDHDRVVQEQIQKGRRYVLYELPIDKYRQITIDNFVTFDNDGYYISNLFGEVMNRNIIKEIHTDDPLHIVPRYLTCVYSTDSLPNEANTLIPTNDDYISGYITLRQEYYELDDHFEEFMSDFDIAYDKNIHYGENLSKALDYITCYNQNKLDKAYEKLSTVNRITYKASNFINMLEKIVKDKDDKTNLNYHMELDREVFRDTYYDSYPIYFVNGLVPDWYMNTTYSNNRMDIKMENKPNASDNIELFLFRKIHNFLYKLDSVIGNNEPKRYDKDIDGSIIINKNIFTKYLFNTTSFDYIRGEYNNDGYGTGIIYGQIELNKFDMNYDIDSNMTMNYIEIYDEIGLTSIDGKVNVNGYIYDETEFGENEIYGSLELILTPSYLKQNILKGYEFINNTLIDNSYINITPSELNIKHRSSDFIKYNSNKEDLGIYRFDLSIQSNITIEFSDIDYYYNIENNYWYGYPIKITNYSDNIIIYNYELDMNYNNANNNTLSVPFNFTISFYTNDENYIIPIDTYKFKVTITMINKNNNRKSSSININLNIIDSKDLILKELEFKKIYKDLILKELEFKKL